GSAWCRCAAEPAAAADRRDYRPSDAFPAARRRRAAPPLARSRGEEWRLRNSGQSECPLRILHDRTAELERESINPIISLPITGRKRRGRLTAWYVAIAIGPWVRKAKRPHQRPTIRPAPATEPALHSFGLAVLVMPRSTAVTGSLPTSLGHVWLVRQTLGLGPDAQAHRLPRGIVAVAWPYQGVSDFVQECIADEG